MSIELSKKEKKLAREIIEMGLQKEFAKGLSDADTILSKWKNRTQNNREAYHLLYNHIIDFDKHIAKRYDRITGSNYIFIIAAQLYDSIITEDDLTDFSIKT